MCGKLLGMTMTMQRVSKMHFAFTTGGVMHGLEVVISSWGD
jgi:hypothetical protein